jgi:glycine/D-amino acid oxidase-like deaminating enzyme
MKWHAVQLRQPINSPTYLGGSWDPIGTALVEPAKMAWGLRLACLENGVRIYEHTPVIGVRREASARLLETACGKVRAARVALASNAFPSLLRRLRSYTVPVYDLALVTEPLSAQQMMSLAGVVATVQAMGQTSFPIPAHPRQQGPVGRVRRAIRLRQPDRLVV